MTEATLERLPPFLTEGVAETIAEQHGTPVLVYDEATFLAQADRALSFSAPYGLTVRYAMKANPHKRIIELFNEQGIHIDASSGFEARRAITAGVAAANILLTSQEFPAGRTYREEGADIDTLLREGVLFNATSPHQLDQYGRLFPGTSVSVRINPHEGSGGTPKTTTGGSASSFGTWYRQVDVLKDIARQHDLKIERLHTHVGSGADPDKWRDIALSSLKMVESFPDVKTLNIGGGLPIARMSYEEEADIEKISQPINDALVEFGRRTGRNLHLEIEPGTFLVGPAGALIASVMDIVSTGKHGFTFYKLNTGMDANLRPSQYAARHPISTIPLVMQNQYNEQEDAVVVGHCCESGDIMTPAKGSSDIIEPRLLSKAAVGSLAVIGGVGAYAYGFSVEGYNSFPAPSAVMIARNGALTQITRRGTLADMTRREM
jgi:diaminopimelate decarboxylase